MINNGKKAFKVDRGSKIAQLIIEKIDYSTCEEMESLDNIERGDKGFGSRGK